MSLLSDKFTERVSMKMVAERYGLDVNNRGFMKCPFHKDDTPSLRVYDKDGSGFFCFGCNKGGSIVQFVIDYFDLGYTDALKKLDNDFNLHILEVREDKAVSRRYSSKSTYAKLHSKRKRMTYDQMIRLYCKYHLSIKFDEPMSDSFCEALYKITDLEYQIECEEEGAAHNGSIHT